MTKTKEKSQKITSVAVEEESEKKNWVDAFFTKKLFYLQNVPVRTENIPFFLIHLSPLLLFYVDFQWSYVFMAIGLYFLRMFFITGFYHRYFSHRGYRVPSRITQFIMAFCGCTAGQQGPLWWASHHRHHHRHSDTERDLHSPTLKGFWYSHVLWIIDNRNHPEFRDRRAKYPKDLVIFPELLFLERYWLFCPIFLGVIVYLFLGWGGVVWYLISTVVCYHGTFTINSLSHIYGKRRFDTSDTSTNNLLLAFVTLGEGWHNNHHAYAGGAKAGFFWYEIDITYYMLWLLSKLGLITDLGAPPKGVLEWGKTSDKLRSEAFEKLKIKTKILKSLNSEELTVLLKKIAHKIDHANLRTLDLPDLKKLIKEFREGLSTQEINMLPSIR